MAKQGGTGVFSGWWVVAGSGVGIAFGSVVFMSSAFAQLASAWGQGFGWTQPQLANAATIYLVLQTLTYPVFGWLLDRWGSRRVASASIVLFALALVVLSRVDDALWQLYAAFALIGLFSAGTNVVSYARAISLWFDRKRGLALGLAAGCQAVGAVLLPILAAEGIASWGWSRTVLAIAAFELLVCLPLVVRLVKDSPAPYGLQPDGDVGNAPAPIAAQAQLLGATRTQVLRSSSFWRLALAFAAMGLTAYAISINIVFILTQTAGLTPPEVAKVQAAAGAAVLLGRVGFGWLLDRLRAPVVGLLAVGLSALGIALYAQGGSLTPIIVGAVLLGASIGGEADLMPYLASRYFGTRVLSSVFGWFLTAFFVGAAIGPVAFASLATSQQSTTLPLYLLIALQIVPVLVFATLGRYPTQDELQADAPSAALTPVTAS